MIRAPERAWPIAVAAVELIADKEQGPNGGPALKAYKCPAGVWTCGYGSTGPDIGPATEWTIETAEFRMRQDAARVVAQAVKLSPILASYPFACAAVADFIYNLGSGRYKASTLKRRIDGHDWQGAAAELPKWVWGGGKKLPGLVIRREVEAQLILGGSAFAEQIRLKRAA